MEQELSLGELLDIARRYEFLSLGEEHLQALRAKRTERAFKECRIINAALLLIEELHNYQARTDETNDAFHYAKNNLIDAMIWMVEDGVH